MRGIPRPKAFLFDLDETLLDNAPVAAILPDACREIASAFVGLSAEELLSSNQAVFSAYWAEVEMAWTLGRLDTPRFSTEIWRRALYACGVKDERAADFAFATHSRHSLAARRLFDDALPVLDKLENSLLLGVVTNGAADLQRDKLQSMHLETYFHVVAISGELGVAKPDAAIFHFALDRIAAGPHEVWHVGDSLKSDVAGANASGVVSVWLNRRGLERSANDPQPAIEIRSLTEIVDYLNVGGWNFTGSTQQ